jgi:hypothetical protein
MLRRVKRFALAASLLVLTACRPPAEPAADRAEHEAEVMKWRQNRDSRLRREDGWLTLVGLHWLSPGKNEIGSAGTNAIVLPANAPARIGTLELKDGQVTLVPAAGAPLTIDGQAVAGPVRLYEDAHDAGPTIVHSGSLNFQIIKRGERFGVRVKDAQAPERLHFQGMDYFPIDPRWRFVARFEPYQPARRVTITDVTGAQSEQTVPGALVFEADGKPYRLDAIDEGPGELFVIFKDETSRDLTYPAGRYLYVPRPGADGTLVLDFNKAYNPPCVFTPFATCPLPPPQNRLPIRIEAGEKNYKSAAKAAAKS